LYEAFLHRIFKFPQHTSSWNWLFSKGIKEYLPNEQPSLAALPRGFLCPNLWAKWVEDENYEHEDLMNFDPFDCTNFIDMASPHG